MSVSNPWMSPLQRSYHQIKNQVIDTMKIRVPEVTDFSEGNIFIMILGIFSAIAEVLHYYIDNAARESHFVTARRYSSLIKHAAFVDYHVLSAFPAHVDINVTRGNGEKNTNDVVIPINTLFTDPEGKEFISTKSVVWQKDTYGVMIPCVQKRKIDSVTIGTITSEDVIITLGQLSPEYYVEGSMNLTLTLSGIPESWELVNTFAYSKPDSKHFLVTVDDTFTPYIKFGDGRFGKKPTVGSSVTGSYYLTFGENGNVDPNRITSIPSAISSLVPDAVCTNLNKATAGTNYEGFDMLKVHVPLSIKTLGVAVSEEDYKDTVMLIPGVDKAYINYICGKNIEIYITPDGGGIAPQSLVDYVQLEMTQKKVMTTILTVKATDEARIVIDATITGRKSFKSNDITTQVKDALKQAFNYETSDIAKPVRLSDLYAILENLSMVDFLLINNLYLIPAAIKVGTTTTSLNYEFRALDITGVYKYLLRYNADNTVSILNSNGTPTGKSCTVGDSAMTSIELDGNSWDIRVSNPLAGTYVSGNLWEITIQPNNKDQLPNDYTIPIFREESTDLLPYIIINVNETV